MALLVDHAGGTTFETTQKIVFDNYTSKDALATDLGLTGSYNDADIINKMVEAGNLKTDI